MIVALVILGMSLACSLLAIDRWYHKRMHALYREAYSDLSILWDKRAKTLDEALKGWGQSNAQVRELLHER